MLVCVVVVCDLRSFIFVALVPYLFVADSETDPYREMEADEHTGRVHADY